jgi:nucleoside-diphosphate-sugar epimerase
LKILITGASGFIGSRMLGRLLASSSSNNYQIIWITHMDTLATCELCSVTCLSNFCL